MFTSCTGDQVYWRWTTVGPARWLSRCCLQTNVKMLEQGSKSASDVQPIESSFWNFRRVRKCCRINEANQKVVKSKLGETTNVYDLRVEKGGNRAVMIVLLLTHRQQSWLMSELLIIKQVCLGYWRLPDQWWLRIFESWLST